MSDFDFDFNAVPDAPEFIAMPEGDYMALMTSAEKKANKAGTGSYLAVVYEVIDGQYKGRKLFEYMNLWHPNKNTVEMAQRDIKKICIAMGFSAQPRDATELLNKPVILSLTTYIEEYKGKKQEKNKISGWKSAAGGVASSPAAAAGGFNAPAPAAKAPWA